MFNLFNTKNTTSNTSFNTDSSIQINGETFSGGNVSIINGEIIIDGNKVNSSDSKTINIVVQGNCGDIVSDNGNITIEQSAANVESKNGTINIKGSVGNNVENKNGNIKIQGDVQGNCTTKNGNISK